MFARYFALTLTLLAAKSAFSQPLPDRKPLVGSVVDSEGKPIPGAYLSIRRQDNGGSYGYWGGDTLTDSKGNFRFSQAETGTYYLNGELAGYAPLYNFPVDWKLSGQPIRVSLAKLVTLKFAVTKVDGTPASGTDFWIRLRGDGMAGQTTRTAKTDAAGNFSLDNLIPANYSLFLSSKQGYAAESRIEMKGNLTRSLQLKAGSALHVVTSDGNGKPVGGVQLSLTPEDPVESARLMGDPGDPNEDYALLASGSDRLAVISRDGDGRIDLMNVPPGKYKMRLRGNGIEPSITSQVIEAGEQNLTPQVRLTAGDKSTLTVEVVNAEGKPHQGKLIFRFLPIDDKGKILTMEISADAPGGDAGRHGVTDAEGKISLYPVIPGRYRYFVSRIQSDAPLELVRGRASSDVTVTPGTTSAKLVLNGKP